MGSNPEIKKFKLIESNKEENDGVYSENLTTVKCRSPLRTDPDPFCSISTHSLLTPGTHSGAHPAHLTTHPAHRGVHPAH